MKATENRAAVVIANEWKEQNDKVISVKQWIEERRVLEVIFYKTIHFKFLLENSLCHEKY